MRSRTATRRRPPRCAPERATSTSGRATMGCAAWRRGTPASKNAFARTRGRPSGMPLELDPNYDFGAIDGFLISYEASRQGAHEEFTERSREHFKRAVALTHGQLAYPFVALAETVDVKKQDRAEFESLLRRALEVDPDARPEWRLNNLIAQRRARWLLSRIDDLFLEHDGGK